MNKEEFRAEAYKMAGIVKRDITDWLLEKFWDASRCDKPEKESYAQLYTCNTCAYQDDCLYVWDDYNTEGNCLGHK